MSDSNSLPGMEKDRTISFSSRSSLGRPAWLVLVLFLVVIFPIPPQLFGFLGEGFAFLSCLFVLGIFLLYTRAKIYLPSLYICGLLFLLLVGSLLRDSANSIPKDFLELLRPVFWFVIFSLFYGVYGKNKGDQSLRLIMNFILFVAVWGIAEALLPLPSSYYYIYRLPGSVYEGKAIASFIAPYAYAAVIGIGAIFFFAKAKIQNNLRNLFFSIICVTAILFSQSKSAIFGILFVVTLMQMSYNKVSGILLLLPFIGFTGALVFFSGSFNYVIEFAVNVSNAYSAGGISSLPAASPSIGNRVQQFQEMFLYLDPIFLFGRGIGKDYLYLESSPALILFRYGVFGFMTIFLVFYSTLFRKKRIRTRLQNPDWRSLSNSLFYLFIYFGIVSLSSNLIDQFKVAFFYIGILGLWFAKTNANEGTVSSNREKKILAQRGAVGT